MMSSTSIQKEDPAQQVQPQVSALPEEAVSLNGMEYTQKEIKEKSSPPRKPLKAKFTIRVGAFTNAVLQKSTLQGLIKRGIQYTQPRSKKKMGNFSKYL